VYENGGGLGVARVKKIDIGLSGLVGKAIIEV